MLPIYRPDTPGSLLPGLMLLVALALAAAPGRAQDPTRVRIVATLPASGRNGHYAGNRAPLLASPLVKLPVGAVRPQGWLKTQLDLMAGGMSGRLMEISPWCKFENSAWASPTGVGANGWEELPYWLKGFTSLGYVLDNEKLIAEARKWIDAILASQRPDGYFGPESNRATPDLWPNMLALNALRTHYEATADPRVVPFMLRYFRWMQTIPRDKLYPGDWQKIRGGDNLDVIYWLYNQTGEPWLLDLAKLNHERTDDWVKGIMPFGYHGVNFAQGFREPAQYYQQSADPAHLAATERNYETMRGQYGQVPGGMYGADENARPGFTGPRQGAETCAIVEMMYSDEMLTRITGNSVWADRCEDVAFNTLPCAQTPDLEGLHYLTCPNQVQLDRQNKAPMIQNAGDMFSYTPFAQYRCCQHNVAFGWPYFAEHLWMATADNGLAAVLYAPCEVRATVGDGVRVHVVEKTDYPFHDTVAFDVSPERPAAFALVLRVPGWCTAPRLKVNGRSQAVPRDARGWLVIERTWRAGDTLQVQFPMTLTARVWEQNRGTVSVNRGPLTYSLNIGERWEKYGDKPQWPEYQVLPTTAWNYGLVLNPDRPADTVKVARVAQEIAPQPFTPDAAPIVLKARAKKIAGWGLERNGILQEVQPGPIQSPEPTEEIELIPMGCARLRLSAFPRIGDGPDAHAWRPVAAPDVKVQASTCWIYDTVDAVSDGVLPSGSGDQSIPRFTWWDHVGTQEWIQMEFPKARRVSSVGVYWFDDEPGGRCRVPASWRLLWWDGSNWKPLANASTYGVEKDRFNEVTFDPVETAKLRIEVQLKAGASGGILEWRVR